MDVCSMAPMSIKIPDGRLTIATKRGKVCLGTQLQLVNVFYVDGLDCHPISVSQLSKDNGCIVQMFDRICVVQDRITQTLIGAGEQINGLYFFRGVAVASQIQSSYL